MAPHVTWSHPQASGQIERVELSSRLRQTAGSVSKSATGCTKEWPTYNVSVSSSLKEPSRKAACKLFKQEYNKQHASAVEDQFACAGLGFHGCQQYMSGLRRRHDWGRGQLCSAKVCVVPLPLVTRSLGVARCMIGNHNDSMTVCLQ